VADYPRGVLNRPETHAPTGSALRGAVRSEALRVPKPLMERSRWRPAAAIATAHLWTVMALAVGLFMPGGVAAKVVVGFVAILIGERSLQTLVHHLSHDMLSKDRERNDRLGNLLVAGFVGIRIQNYRRVHFVHHAENGSSADPEFIDFDTVDGKGGLRRFVLSYVTGGEVLGLLRKYYGSSQVSPPSAPAARRSRSPEATATGGRRFVREVSHIVVCQLVLIAAFVFIAQAWYLYIVWLYVAVTWSPLLSKLRFLVEHPGKDDRTVSTLGPWFEVLVFAPFNFNYHWEHHVWPTLPPYRLDGMHRHLVREGFFDRYPEFTTSSFIRSLGRRAASSSRAAPSPS